MSELVLFTLNGIVVYLVSDWLLRLVEKRRGSAIKQRQVVFFVIFLALALVSFRVMKMLLGAPVV
jgi:hypothetical protein